ncbi:MAG: hypothetical protein JW849_04640, partial [Phycisphaerae bacterium]|nr:hypothetical protein [Phycisphaerae bacterium]
LSFSVSRFLRAHKAQGDQKVTARKKGHSRERGAGSGMGVGLPLGAVVFLFFSGTPDGIMCQRI